MAFTDKGNELDIHGADYIASWWVCIKDFLNSVFFTAIAGSMAGAFAGAWAAQRIAEKEKLRDQLLKEIRGTNTAIMLSLGICNSLIQIKRQHVKPLKDSFEAQLAALQNHKQKRDAGLIAPEVEFRFLADMQILSLPPLPIDILQTEAFEKISLEGRPISLTTTLGQTIHNLRLSMAMRNNLIETHMASKEEIKAEDYFGLPTQGKINEMYPSLVRAIYKQTDEGIFFSHLLCQDLIEHGKSVVEQFEKNFKKGAPKINGADFSKAKELGLLPSAEGYGDWFTAFVKSSDTETK